jgi:hypothetical protein
MNAARALLRIGVIALAASLSLTVAAVLLVHSAQRAPGAKAVEAGLNCETYAEGVCVVAVGDIFFCDLVFTDFPCPSSLVAGETLRWVYPDSAMLTHTTTECGDDCDSPTDAPLWDSGVLRPGDTYDVTFSMPGIYNYYCRVHPQQRGIIRVLEPDSPATPTPVPTPPPRLGDVDCSGAVTSIDAALILQLEARLLASLPCAQNGDTNQDGRTNAIDASLILQYSAGLVDSLPVSG